MSITPDGSWGSPITYQRLFAKAIKPGGPRPWTVKTCFWTEMRLEGRGVIVRRSPDGVETDLTPPGFGHSRAPGRRVRWQAGYVAAGRGTIYFSNFREISVSTARPQLIARASPRLRDSQP